MRIIRIEYWIASLTLFFNAILQLDAAGNPVNRTFDRDRISKYPFDRINKFVDPCQNFHGFVCGRSGTEELKADIPIDIKRKITQKRCNQDYDYLCEAYWHAFDLCGNITQSAYLKFYRQKLRELSEVKRRTYMGITNFMLDTIPTPLFYYIDIIYEMSPVLSITIDYKMKMDENLLYYVDGINNARLNWRNVIDKKLTNVTSRIDNDVSIKITVGEFQSIATSVDWVRYLTALLPDSIHRYLAAKKRTVEDLPVFTNSRAIIAEYDQIIGSLQSRDVLAKAVVTLAAGSAEIVKECKAFVEQSFEILSFRIFYEMYNKNVTMLRQSIQPINEIMQNVRNAYIMQIIKSPWIGSSGRVDALVKLLQMKADFGAPEVLLNNTLFYEHFAALDIIALMDTNNPVEALDLVSRWRMRQNLALTVPSERQSYKMSVDAYYLPLENRIFVGSIYTRDYFFEVYKPAELNYGSIGVIIAHEMGRALSVFGQHYLGGEFQPNMTLWNKNEFDERRSCFADQYQYYKYPSETMPTDDYRMDENLADYMGVLAAYAAMNRLLEDEMHHINVKTKFQSSFSEQQLFFISYAYTICDRLRMDLNSPSEPRVNVPLANMPEFAEAFDCPVGTPMNPTSKCSIWH